MKPYIIVLLLVIISILMTGCDPYTSNKTDEYDLPVDLKEAGCEIIIMSPGAGSDNKVSLLRCRDGIPKQYLPQTSTNYGKGQNNTLFVMD